MMKATLSCMSICILLAACRSGGPVQPASEATNILLSSAGVYKGTLESHQNVTLLAFYDGTVWLFYDTPAAAQNALGGVIIAFSGQQSGNDHYESVNARNFSLQSSEASSASLSIDFSNSPAVGGSIDGSKGGRAQTKFTATADAMPAQSASLSSIAGLYTGRAGMLAGTTTSRMTVTSDGLLAGMTSGGCIFHGNIEPTSGVNAYNVSFTFGPAPCAAAGSTVVGHAVLDEGHLMAALPNRDHSDLFVFDGRK